jgi:hypothetical protein
VVDERRVDGVAVTRHAVFVIPSILIGTVDVDWEFDGPLVAVEFRGEIVLDGSTPAVIEFLLNRVSPPNDRNDVGVIMRLQQGETLAVVESAVEIDGFDAELGLETFPYAR